MKKVVTQGAPQAPGLLSQGVDTESGFLFVSGQIHQLPDGELLEGSVTAKTQQVMKNLQAILEAGGQSFSDVVKVTIYLTNMADRTEVNDVYVSYFSEPFPAREMVCVKELPLGASIEMSLVATKG